MRGKCHFTKLICIHIIVVCVWFFFSVSKRVVYMYALDAWVSESNPISQQKITKKKINFFLDTYDDYNNNWNPKKMYGKTKNVNIQSNV